MRKVLVGVCLLAFAVSASANLLVNPGFEIGYTGPTNALFPATDGFSEGSAQPWWAYADTMVENWGNGRYSGSNAVAFAAWNAGGYAGFGQDVVVSVDNGSVVQFSIFGRAEAQYSSSANETWMKLEFWSGGVMQYAVTNDIFSAITAVPDSWNQYTFTYTNTMAGIDMVKPMVGGGNFTDIGGSQAATWDDASFVIIPEPTIAGLLGFAGLLICALRRKTRK